MKNSLLMEENKIDLGKSIYKQILKDGNFILYLYIGIHATIVVIKIAKIVCSNIMKI